MKLKLVSSHEDDAKLSNYFYNPKNFLLFFVILFFLDGHLFLMFKPYETLVAGSSECKGHIAQSLYIRTVYYDVYVW